MKPQLLAAALCLTAFSTIMSAAPIAMTGEIQWSSGSGGNDHYYQLYYDNSFSGGIGWTDADIFATNIGRYLVTYTSAPEENFVNSTFNPFMPAGSGNAGGTCCPHFWIGLSSPGANGVYQWVTGEALGYTNWMSGEPNNPATEPYVVDRWQGQQWNNLPNTQFLPASFFVVERESAVPEPGSMVMMGVGGVALALARLRRR